MENNTAMERVFETILKVYQPKYANKASELSAYAERLDSWEFLGLVATPRGKKDEHPEDIPPFVEEEWIDQYQNGGYSGDSYAGYTYLKIAEDTYLKFHYQM